MKFFQVNNYLHKNFPRWFVRVGTLNYYILFGWRREKEIHQDLFFDMYVGTYEVCFTLSRNYY